MESHFMDLFKKHFWEFFEILHSWSISGDSFSDYEDENINLHFLLLF